jgi:hypothetical protein
MTSINVIVMSHLPLPYKGIGSWTNIYSQYLKGDNSQVTHIVCPKFKRAIHGR